MAVADFTEQQLRSFIQRELGDSRHAVLARQGQGAQAAHEALTGTAHMLPFVTSLPVGAVVGQVCRFQTAAMAALSPPVAWTLVFDGAKWLPDGGAAPLFSEVTAGETTASPTYAALTTAGPSVALPVAGDYDVMIGAGVSNNTAGQEAWMSYDIGGTAAVDADKVAFSAAAAMQKAVAVVRRRRKVGLGAVTLAAKYRVGGGTGQWQERFMAVWPVRLG